MSRIAESSLVDDNALYGVYSVYHAVRGGYISVYHAQSISSSTHTSDQPQSVITIVFKTYHIKPGTWYHNILLQ